MVPCSPYEILNKFKSGTRVQIDGLEEKPELNGQYGTVVPDEDSKTDDVSYKRFHIKFQDKSIGIIAIKPKYLIKIPPPPPDLILENL